MPDTELITIGAFARACGLSASALRFYADAGVLTPALIDEDTGYRYYAPEQSTPARLLRHLRAVGMPLPAVATVLAEPDPTRAITLLDHHLADLDRHQEEVRAAAAAARAVLATHGPQETPAALPGELWVSGPALAAAVDQIATATVAHPELRVLDTVLFEVDGQQLILTATDRYRLATRTVRPMLTCIADWVATVDADDLRSAVSWLRRRYSVALRPAPSGIEFTTATAGSGVDGPTAANGESVFCRRSADDFPDYRAMLAALPAVRTRVVLARATLLDAVETLGSATVTLHANPDDTVSVTASDGRATTIPARITGPAVTIHFAVTTLYPAIATAVGPDVMLDLIAPDQPALIRSADDGDLSTLAMPCKPDPTEETVR
ncbi:DNA polymerase III subunit beta family protein [Nocardia sp. FBN12]|uniref:DNA polymerase III subunit beta family protein n=1 Tax=Nocardia sp. FBN12 TaxID=3419766 RepID=UPI003CFE8DBD